MYLTHSATEAILRTIASYRPGTTLVVNFVLPPEELDELAASVSASAAKAVASSHEPVVTGYTAGQAATMLHEAGFSRAAVLNAEVLSRRYLRSRPDLRFPASTVTAVATV